MSSGRPDFHPSVLLEGKHDTQLIPILVDAAGQMYIVMTGQQISVGNLPSDYFKAGQAIGQSNVGVTNLPSDYFKASENIGGVDSNVTVDQSAKDRDTMGLDGATRRQIAVDAAGIILARLKGAYGAVLKDVAVDDVGVLLARMKGASAGVLKDVAVDDSGFMLAKMLGNSSGTPTLAAVDSGGNLLARLLGLYDTSPIYIQVDAAGNLLARMKGYDGAALQDVKVDSAGYMLAKMTGLDGATLRTVAVDASGKIIAVIQGSAGLSILQDAAGNLLARMKGYDGANLQDVKVDTAGYMLAKMTGLDGATLRTVAVDADGVMKANLSAQSLDFLKVQPTYAGRQLTVPGDVTVPDGTETVIVTLAGKGVVVGGLVWFTTAFAPNLQHFRILVDGNEIISESVSELYAQRWINTPYYPLYVMKFDQVGNWYNVGIGQPITFETSFSLTAVQDSGVSKIANARVIFALVP